MKLHIALLMSLALPHTVHSMETFAESWAATEKQRKEIAQSLLGLTDHERLCNAFKNKDLKSIEEFLDKTTDFNQPIILSKPSDPNGNFLSNTTLLELAWQHQLPDVVSQLRGYGVSLETTDEEGNCPPCSSARQIN